MELKRALELRAEYNGISGLVKCDGDYICLNDLAEYFPNKRLDHWLENRQTIELIAAVEKSIIPGKAGIIAKRGKGGGTFAHNLIALDFAAWLSVEFKLKVYMEYTNGTQHKQDWNIQRIMAANNFKLMTRAISDAHEDPKPYHYSNEALMINEIAFGVREGSARDTATEEQLNDVSWLEWHNGAYIGLGMDYQERKAKLTEMFAKRNMKNSLDSSR